MKTLLLSISLTLSLTLAKAQATFERTFGTSSDEYVSNLTLGAKKSTVVYGRSSTSLYLAKIDSSGQKMWSKTYPISNPYSGSIMNTADGGYILSGYGDTGPAIESFILKVDSLGNVAWMKGYEHLHLMALKQIIGKGYIGIGQTDFQEKGLIIKFDSLGTIVWKKRYSPLTADRIMGRDVIQLKSDSGFMVTSVYLPSPGTNNPAMLSRFDKNGQHQWSKVMNSLINDNWPNQLVETPDGKIRFKCRESILEFDANGNNGKRLLINPFGLNLSSWQPSVSDKGYLLAGTIGVNTSTYGSADVYLAKLDSLGNFLWLNTYGSTKYDYDPIIKQSADKKITIAATTENFTNHPKAIYLIKTDSLGVSCSSKPFAYTTSTSTISTSNLGVLLDSVYFVYQHPLTINSTLLLADSLENACICKPPTANFSIMSSGFIEDQSTWGDKWYWTFSDGTQDSSNVAPAHNFGSNGTYTVCLTVKNSCGTSSVCTTFNYVNMPVGIQSLSKNSLFTISPNPVHDILTTISAEDFTMIETEIFDVTGKKVIFSYKEKFIDVSTLSPGMYFIKVATNKGEHKQKFIKE